MIDTNLNFIKQVATYATQDEKQTGVLACITIAQAILESNWGKSRLTREANNLFGIKASRDYNGKVWTGETGEYYNNQHVTIKAGFRVYNSYAESIRDHSNFLLKYERYKKVIGEKNYLKACEYLGASGYATDPNYGVKLKSLIEGYNLTQYNYKGEKIVNEIQMNINGKVVKVHAIVENDTTYVQLRDLQKHDQCNKIEVGYAHNMPYLKIKK